MTTIIRSKCGKKAYQPCRKAWDLDVQIKKLKIWIAKNTHKLKNNEWIIDIGYCDSERPDACVCGYTIPIDLMELCVRHKITIWLSSYTKGFDSVVDQLRNKSAQQVDAPEPGTSAI